MSDGRRPPSPSDWSKVEPLLDELLDLDVGERAGRLASLERENPELHAAVVRLLAIDESAEGPLDAPLGTFAAAVLAGGVEIDVDERRGTGPPAPGSVGPYRVISEIGHGGMGSVFLAERTDGEFEHRVALKLVRGINPEIVDRFRHERQILARLRHPNVAALFDGGATEDGQPYFAMEYVDGVPITRYCDENRLDVDARILLFGDVCRAVQYAHRNLVVHRDLKPGNVLVAGDGTVKLLDFGIAKVVDTEGNGAATTSRQFLTPAYAAPEQVRGEPTSTATDIYSLGVLLYELLTGKNPHGDTSRPAEVARAVLDTEPPSASTAVGEVAARERGGDVMTIKRRLRGDLDTILQKALRKEPDERYTTADELRRDLERHRLRQPISARPATLGYRLSKFVRRNRIGAGAIVAVALSLIGGISGIVWQAAVAAEERDRARAEASRAQATQAFLLDVFSAADPTAEPGEALTAVDLAHRGADRIGEAFASEPAQRAEATHMLGTVFLRLGEYERADSLLTAAYEAKKALGDDPGVVAVLNELGETEIWLRRLDDAEARFEEALGLGESALGPDDEMVTGARLSLGLVSFHRGDYDEAERTIRTGLANARRVHGNVSESVRNHLMNLGTVLSEGGKPEEAAEVVTEALAIDRQLDPDGLETAETMSALADLLGDLDRDEESVELAREAVAVMREVYGEEGHSNLAIAISNLAGVVRDRGDYEEAIRLGNEVIEIFERRLGPEHPYIARAHNNVAVTYKRAEDYEAAAKEYAEAIRVGKIGFGPRHPALIPFLANYGSLLLELERYAESESIYRETITLSEETDSNAFGKTYALLGLMGVLRHTDRLEEAEAVAREALRIRQETVGEGHSAELHARISVASIVTAAGRYEESRPIIESVIADARAGMPNTWDELVRGLEERAVLARDGGEPDSVEASFLRELEPVLAERFAPDHPRMLRLRERVHELEGLTDE